MRTRRVAMALASVLVSLLAMPVGRARAADGPRLTVDVRAGRHEISPDIYGMNFPEEALANELKLGMFRFGGNSTSRYNYQSKTTNRANDYFFLNAPFDYKPGHELTLEDFVARGKRLGVKSLVTVPLLGYVTDPAKPGACGFSVKKYGKQTGNDRDCGSGMTPDNKPITGNNPLETSIAIGPDFVRGEVKYLTDMFGRADAGGAAYYSLDNEPSIWNSTHRDVHPAHGTYDEVANKGITYAAAIKQADPTAKVFGPADWGYITFLDSEIDIANGNRADRDAHGGMEFVPWYLEQFKAYEARHHIRVLDYLDEHYYPEAQDGVPINQTVAGDAKNQQVRFETTRALWDPSYLDRSYIGKDMGERMAIIPRLKRYVAEHYPGTKVALTEYNWGGLEAVNGALVQADVLGIFGAEGLDAAAIWTPPKATDAGANAWRLFLSYDGAGARFGNVSVTAKSTDREKVSVYAAERLSDDAVTVVAINKTTTDLTTPIDVTGAPTASRADVWRYAAGAPKLVSAGSEKITGGKISATLPAQSMSLFVIPGKGVADNQATARAAASATTAPAAGSDGSQATTPDADGAASRTGTTKDTGGGASTVLVIAGLLALVGASGFLARAGLLRKWWPALAVGAGVLVVVAASLGGGSSSSTDAGSVSITAPAAGATLRKTDPFVGKAKLGDGDRLYLLVYAPGAKQYYEVTEPRAVPVVDGKWSMTQYVTGEPGDTYTVYAFILPADKAAAWEAADKTMVKALPEGAEVQDTAVFKIE